MWCCLKEWKKKLNICLKVTVEMFILFGGEPYLGRIVSQGPFGMNSRDENYQANADYQKGKYGSIKYN